MEAWNRRLNTVVAKPHPNIFALVDALKAEEDYTEGLRDSVDAGETITKKKKKYVDNNDKRLTLPSPIGSKNSWTKMTTTKTRKRTTGRRAS